MKENISTGIAVLAIVISIAAIVSTVIVKPVSTIDANSVGGNELADNSVTGSKVADGTLTDADISDTGISKIADDAITSTQIASSSIMLEHLTSAVIAAMTGVVNIANNSITGAKIVDGTITNVDISDSADIDPSKILGTAWTATNDGSGSGLDADTLDGINSGELIRNDGGTANYIPKFTGSTTIGKSVIYETAGGNVGIGTTSPTQKLEVNGEVKASAFIGNGSKITDINGTWGEENNWYSTSGKALTTESYVHIYKGNLLRFWSSSNSLVGNIYGSATSPGQLRIQADSGGDVAIVNDAGNGLIVKDNGNLGIGTTNPTSKLHVIGKGTFTGGVDPPYVSFSKESHESIRQYARDVEDHEEAMQFWNGEAHRMEIYVISEDAFYTLTGDLVEE